MPDAPYRFFILEFKAKLYFNCRDGRNTSPECGCAVWAVVAFLVCIISVLQGIANGGVQGQLVGKSETASNHGVEIETFEVAKSRITHLHAKERTDRAIDKVNAYIGEYRYRKHFRLVVIFKSKSCANKLLW